MKRKLLFLVLAIAAFIAWSLYTNDTAQISNVMKVLGDDSGNIYVIDNKNYKSRLIKINSEGKVAYVVNADKYEDGYFSYFADMAVDSSGNLYLDKTKVNSDTYEAVHETIAKYDSTGKLVRNVYSFDTSKKDMVWLSDIKAVSCDDRYVYIFSAKAGAGEIIAVSPDKENEIIKRVSVPEAEESLLSEVLVINTGSAYYTNKLGEIYYVGEDQESRLVYPDAGELSGKHIPKGMSMDRNGNLYFTDLMDISYKKLDTASYKAETVISDSKTVDQGSGLLFSDLRNAYTGKNGEIVASCFLKGKSAVISLDGTGARIIDNFRFQDSKYVRIGIICFAGALMLYLLTLLAYEIYTKLINRRVPILIKQFAVLLPLIMISMLFLSNTVSRYITRIVDDELYSQLYSVAQLVSERVDAENIKSLTSPRDFMSDTYVKLSDSVYVDFSDFQSVREGGYSLYIYSDLNRYIDGGIRAVISSDGNTVLYPKRYTSEDRNVVNYTKEVYRDNKIKVCEYTDVKGIWMCALAPIHDAQGEIAGVLEIGIGKKTYYDYVNNYSNKITVLNIVTTVPLLLVLMLSLYLSLRPLRILQKGVSEIAVGKLDTVIETKSRDEMGDFAKVVNKMSYSLKARIEEITRYNEAYYKFVPQQLMTLLGKESVLDVKLGEYVKKDVAILVLNIRDFYKISAGMPPEGIFQFINSAFNTIAPIIRENGGFIVKYTDTGMIAFFPTEHEQALRAAVLTQEAIMSENKEAEAEGSIGLELGIAIHKGPVLLGIIGEEMRLDAAALSEDVHIASMLRGLGITYGSGIIASHEFISSIEKGTSSIRHIGQITHNDREIALYDCFDGDAVQIKFQKREMIKTFEEAVALYKKGELYDARALFIELVKRCPDDKMSKIYVYLSDSFLNEGMPEPWDPALNYYQRLNRAGWGI